MRRTLTTVALSVPFVARAATRLTRRRRPIPPAADWDIKYKQGAYDRLGDLDELAHHAVIAGYVARLNPDGRVLDIGCGGGTTEKLLRRWCAFYHGVDFSGVAVSQAQASASSHARFTVADAQQFWPDAPYDVIIMNEVVEYFSDLELQIRRYAGHLAPGGHLIVSMWVSRRNLALWPTIDQVLTVRDQSLVRNIHDLEWMIKVYTS